MTSILPKINIQNIQNKFQKILKNSTGIVIFRSSDLRIHLNKIFELI